MKRRFMIAFALLFAVFAAGIGTTTWVLWRSSNDLRQVVGLHQVEELRQALSFRIQRSKQDLQVSGTVFANQLDSIVENVRALDASVQGCFDCHHSPELDLELRRMAALTDRYKSQYSTFITAILNPEQRQSLQLEAAATAEEIDALVDGLVLSASPRVKLRTLEALAQMDRSWRILAVTLVLTFFAAFGISTALVRSVTKPVHQLVDATERIAAGELGFRIEHRERHELGALIDSFNEMNATLASNKRRIDGYLGKLTRLNQAVLSLRGIPDTDALWAHLARPIRELVDAELYGTVLETELEGVFVATLRRAGETTAVAQTGISGRSLHRLRDRARHRSLFAGERDAAAWPFGPWTLQIPLRNFLVCWIDFENEFRGALVAVNKRGGDFEDEDAEVLRTLAGGVAEALENIRRYKSLREEMERLSSA